MAVEAPARVGYIFQAGIFTPATGDVVATTVVAAIMPILLAIFTMLHAARVAVVDRGCVDHFARKSPIVKVVEPAWLSQTASRTVCFFVSSIKH